MEEVGLSPTVSWTVACAVEEVSESQPVFPRLSSAEPLYQNHLGTTCLKEVQILALLWHSIPAPPAHLPRPHRWSSMWPGNMHSQLGSQMILLPGKVKPPNLGFAALLLVALANYLHLVMACILIYK